MDSIGAHDLRDSSHDGRIGVTTPSFVDVSTIQMRIHVYDVEVGSPAPVVPDRGQRDQMIPAQEDAGRSFLEQALELAPDMIGHLLAGLSLEIEVTQISECRSGSVPEETEILQGFSCPPDL
jgi:hypothetical protein